jgi:hypothetical protein
MSLHHWGTSDELGELMGVRRLRGFDSPWCHAWQDIQSRFGISLFEGTDVAAVKPEYFSYRGEGICVAQ